MSFFSVDILTPSGIVAKELEADSIIIPTEGGEINVLPEHTHIVSSLITGIVSINSNSDKKHFLVTSGVCKVLHKKIILLSLTAEESNKIDGKRAQDALGRANEKLAQKEVLSKEEFIKFQRKQLRAEYRIKLSTLN